MGFLSRLAQLIKSNINDLINKSEDPEKMLNQIILDMRDQLAKAKREVAAAIADERKLICYHCGVACDLTRMKEERIEFLEKLMERLPDRTFTVHRIIASEDLVAVHYHSQASRDDPGFAIVDIFRVEGCRMVEHWDVVQAVPEQSANNNTMF